MIAQRACMAKARIERTIYEEILPHLPVTSPRYYGFRAEDPDFAWLFLEDIGDERYDAAEAPGLDAVIRGLALQARDDLHLIELTGPLYDALYALWSGEP